MSLTFSVFIITTSVSEASYNWTVVRGLSPFIAMGMQVPDYVVEYLNYKIINNGYILYRLLIIFVFIVMSGPLVSHHMRRNRLIIDENGMVKLE